MKRVQDEDDAKEIEKQISILTDIALVNSGFTLDDSNKFADNIYRTLSANMGLEESATLKDYEVDLSEIEQEESDNKNTGDVEGTPEFDFDHFNSDDMNI